jgi:sRNA-binding protein
MNPEPPSAADNEVPNDVPAAASPAAPTQAAADAGPAAPGGAASAGASDTAPDPLRETLCVQPTDAAPAHSSAAAAIQAPTAPPATAELSPAACGARLAALFPALFVAPGAPGAPGPAKPIKLRIHADIQARAPGVFTKRVLGIFFSRYTTSNAYLKALTVAPYRFDLDGQPAGEISDEHRRLAAEELARRHTLAAERRTAQRPPPRGEAPAAEGDALPGARREPRPERRAGSRPDTRPAARPMHPQRDGKQRPERGPAAPSSPSPPTARPPRSAERPAREARPERSPPVREVAPPASLPADPAQRERAMLLRSFESSPLGKANFCALKGMTEAALDAALALAQAERGERGAPSSAMVRRGSGGR